MIRNRITGFFFGVSVMGVGIFEHQFMATESDENKTPQELPEQFTTRSKSHVTPH
jgi:hypothetical protein